MNEEKLLSAKRLFFIALGLDILVTAIVIASDLWGVDVLKAIGAGASDADASVISAFAFWDKFAYLMLLTTLGVGLALVKWLNACYSYAILGLGASGFKQQGWTLGGWAIPFFNLFKPYQVINEIYKSGNSTYVESDGWKRVSGSGLLLTWWIFWAVTHLFGWIASKQFIKTALRDDMTLDQTIAAIQFHAGFCVVAIVISGFWFIVANTLTDRLLGREAVARSTESPMRMTDSVQSSPNLSQAPFEPAMFTGNAPTTNIESKRAMTHQAAPQINTTTETSPVNFIAPTEEDHWATAIAELESGHRRPGVWAKAYAEADGDETKGKAAYLKARVHQLVAAEIARLAEQQADLQERQNAIEQARLAEEVSEFQDRVSDGYVPIKKYKFHNLTMRDLKNGQVAIETPKQQRCYMDSAAAKSAAEEYARDDRWTLRGLVIAIDKNRAKVQTDKLKRMHELGITTDQNGNYCFMTYRYERLEDAVAYAQKVNRARGS